MFDLIIVPVVVWLVASHLYRFFELLICKKERLIMIDKIEQLPNLLESEKIRDVYGNLFGQKNTTLIDVKRFNVLKWGSLAVGIGLGLFIGILISNVVFPTFLVSGNYRQMQIVGVLIIASMVFFGGIGLIISYLVERKK